MIAAMPPSLLNRSILILALVLGLGGGLAAQLSEVEKEQLADFRKYIRSKNADERLNQVDLLAHIDGVEATQLCIDHGLTDKDARVRARASWALARKRDPEAVKLIVEEGLVHKSDEVREGSARAIGRMREEIHAEALAARLAEERDALVVIALFRALAEIRSEKGLDRAFESILDRNTGIVSAALELIEANEKAEHWKQVAPLLRHSQWQIQSAALRCLGKLRAKDSIPLVIECMEDSDGRLRGDSRDCLIAITGRQFSHDPAIWKGWWERVGERWEVPRDVKPNTEDEEKYGPADDIPTFHEIRTKSKHIAFVIDVSASMSHNIRYKVLDRSKNAGQTYRQARRIDLAKMELKRIIETLDKNTYFNIITFETEVDAFKKSPVRATAGSISEACRWIDRLDCYRPASTSSEYTKEGWQRGETNTFGVLRYIYGFSNGEPSGFTGKLKPIADTVFLLSDGDPSAGFLVVPDEIKEQVERYHPAGQVVIHTIAYEINGIGRQLMSDIAAITGGKFVEIGAAR